jgi:alpha-L-fucosidase
MELCNNYGKVDLMFFDGGYSFYQTDSYSLYKQIKQAQPNVLINDRLLQNSNVEPDYITPEGSFISFTRYPLWENCNVIGHNWSWSPNSKDEKSYSELILMFLKVIGRDGNFLLGIGPMSNGQFDPRHIRILKEIGKWLTINSDAIYGTRGGPYLPQSWGVSTCKENCIYLHVWNLKNSEILELKSLPAEISSVTLINGQPLQFSQFDEKVHISIPFNLRDSVSTTVVMKINKDAITLPLSDSLK